MTQHEPVRARVAAAAIGKVTRMFSGSLDDILTELFQNARRAGATKIAVSTSTEPTPKIIIADDGKGIASPQALLSLGESDWDAAATLREDPAGMGFFSLASRATTITSSTGGDAFRLAIPEDGWTGERELCVESTKRECGTDIVFSANDDWLRQIGGAVERAARYLPVDVTLDGVSQARKGFLDGATYTKRAGGLAIGVFPRPFSTYEAHINFHGLTLRQRLFSLVETDYSHWSARIDIIDAPELQLVLPARKELVENPHSLALDSLVKAAIFEAIRERGRHCLTKKDWDEAATLGIDLPEADALLTPWQPDAADEYFGAARENPVEPGTDALLVPSFDPFTAQMLHRALALAGAPPFAQLLDARPAYQGYRWYDALEMISDCRPELSHDGSVLVFDQTKRLSNVNTRIDESSLDLILSSGGHRRLSLDLYLEADPDEYGTADEMIMLVTRDSHLSPSELAAYITCAGFCFCDDSDAGSYNDQRDHYEQSALHRAFECLKAGDESDLAKIKYDFGRHIAWLVPKGRVLSLEYDGTSCSATFHPRECETGDVS